jgi:hypothetical protein
MRRKSWKDFHEIPSRNVSEIFTVADRNVYWHNGPYWRKCSLNVCIVFYFSDILWFRKYFEATTYVHFGCKFLTGSLKHTVFELSIYDRKVLMYTVFCLSMSVGTSLSQLFLLDKSDWNSLRYTVCSFYIHCKKNSAQATLPLIASEIYAINFGWGPNILRRISGGIPRSSWTNVGISQQSLPSSAFHFIVYLSYFHVSFHSASERHCVINK